MNESKDQQIGEAILLSCSIFRILVAVALIIGWRYFAESLPLDLLTKRLLLNLLLIGIIFTVILSDKSWIRLLK